MIITASELRKNIYRVLDDVAERGVPVQVRRHGSVISLVAEKKRSKLDNLKKRKVLTVDPESIVHMDWSKEWRPPSI